MPSDHIEPTITRDSSHDKPPEEEPEEVEVKDTPPLLGFEVQWNENVR